MNKTTITAKMRRDGTVVRVSGGRGERVMPKKAPRRMTQEQIERAAASDPDARPMTAAQLRKAPRIPRVKTLRRALGLKQEEFAARYLIPIGTLRDWEQGRSQPDQTARAYLRVIARDPDVVHRLLRAV
jgi:putative transcriptional regulator